MSIVQRLWQVLEAELRQRGRKGTDRPEPQGPEASMPVVDPVLAGYYANLEVPYGSELAAVEAGWKRLLSRYHPDRHAMDPERARVADELVKQLNHGYGELRRHLASRRAA